MVRCAQCGALNRVGVSPSGQSPVCGRCKQALDVSGAPQAVSADEAWRTIASADVPVLVDVWATWCPPCRAVAPTLDQLARDSAGKMIVLKVDSDQNPTLSQQLGVSGIPTFVLFRGGREVSRRSGAMPRAGFDAWLGEAQRTA
ncbi:MAG: thioredoxin fold domain-containing protein [Archangium sp.]|nr:thioredoxin fold domain-containing protein [Archangium sp.]